MRRLVFLAAAVLCTVAALPAQAHEGRSLVLKAKGAVEGTFKMAEGLSVSDMRVSMKGGSYAVVVLEKAGAQPIVMTFAPHWNDTRQSLPGHLEPGTYKTRVLTDAKEFVLELIDCLLGPDLIPTLTKRTAGKVELTDVRNRKDALGMTSFAGTTDVRKGEVAYVIAHVEGARFAFCAEAKSEQDSLCAKAIAPMHDTSTASAGGMTAGRYDVGLRVMSPVAPHVADLIVVRLPA